MLAAKEKNRALNSTPDIDSEDLAYFCNIIGDIAGIVLKASKSDLVKSRLRSRLNAHGFVSFAEYRGYLQSLAKNDPEWQFFTNLLTTNKTDFFREVQHFEFLVQKILPEWLKTGGRTFNVWSAASSTGEEAYTLAMILDRYLPEGRDFRILATDIDTEVLASLQNAVYPLAKKNEIPPDYHARCLDIGRGSAQGWFRIKPRVKGRVSGKIHNLIDRSVPGEDVFDLVLCRNVLIYFAPASIDFVQKKIFKTVRSGGYLFIGHSESFQGLSHCWTSSGPSIFCKVTK